MNNNNSSNSSTSNSTNSNKFQLAIAVDELGGTNDNFIKQQHEGRNDLSLSILSTLCSSALQTLQSLGNQVALPVVNGLRQMMWEQVDQMEICSLGSSSLDDTMDFLLLSFDENANKEALEALLILAIGRGSVYYLLQLAVRLFHDAQLTTDMKPLVLKFLEKCSIIAANEEKAMNAATGNELKRKIVHIKSSIPSMVTKGQRSSSLGGKQQLIHSKNLKIDTGEDQDQELP